MEKNRIYWMIFVLSLLAVEGIGAELEVKSLDSKTAIDPKSHTDLNKNTSSTKTSGSNSVLDSEKVDQNDKGADQNKGSQEKLKKDIGKSNSSTVSGSKEVPIVGKGDNDGSSKESHEEAGNKKEGSSKGLKPKIVPKKEPREGDTDPSRMDSSRGEECDPSNRCTDEKKNLIACLRVPGNDSPDLSLLIQNKGKGPLTVKISAPDFVQLEKSTVQLQEKEDKKVKVSIGNRGNDTSIVLTAGNGLCSLDFGDIQNSEKKIDYSPESLYINLFTRTSPTIFVSLGASLLLILALMFVKFRRQKLPSDGSKYQKLEMELPVSGGKAGESDITDGWDNSWGDSWDDEEAPMTPTLPVTPSSSLSSKGLASRRLVKDGWKD